jgi:cytochrome bd ubiquinol oxidase subunit I
VAASSDVSEQQVGTSLLIFVVTYCLVFGTGIYYMLKLMARGPSLPNDVLAEQRRDEGTGDALLGHRPMARSTDPIDE